jgi:hypothetical protein
MRYLNEMEANKMKHRFSGKLITLGLIAILIVGGTVGLGVAMASAQTAADKEVVTNSVESNPQVEENSYTTTAPLDKNAPTPREQDLSKENAIDLAVREIHRVFGIEVVSFTKEATYSLSFNGSEPGQAIWEVAIFSSKERFTCVLDAVSGQIALLHFCDLSKQPETTNGRYSPLPGDSSYNDCAVKAMSIVNSEANITSVRFFRDGNTGSEIVFWMAVEVDGSDTYLIGITKDERSFVGYSFDEGTIDEALFNQ